jgi:hypothetical protein
VKGSEWLILGVFVVLAIVGGGALVTSIPSEGWPSIVLRFSEAIATAEGFFVNGSRPQRKNNPGDIMSHGEYVVYSSIAEGWQALYALVYKMFYGGSLYYNPTMTISQVAYYYADGKDDPDGAANWAQNVANYMGVTPDTTLNSLMGA